ncbi:MAG: glutamate racemase [Oscillospiraceae bacterium]|nr:glutamate racemase [Oscillospiraceae bacterium]
MDNRAIGVFDSGLGGLTAVKELQKIVPNEQIVFLGDTARVPYGSHDRKTICEYARDDISFLLSHNVKMIIAACGTVSSNFPKEEIDLLPVPFIGILHPTVDAAIKATRNRKIGVIGTEATIRSGAFEREIAIADPGITVVSKACPLFVPLVESGCTSENNQFVLNTTEEYLETIMEAGCDTVVLGCTHYPHLAGAIKKVLGNNIVLINSGKETAVAAARLLASEGLETSLHEGSTQYFVTKQPDNFLEKASFLLGDDISQHILEVTI